LSSGVHDASLPEAEARARSSNLTKQSEKAMNVDGLFHDREAVETADEDPGGGGIRREDFKPSSDSDTAFA
jgi:hypothetical protein